MPAAYQKDGSIFKKLQELFLKSQGLFNEELSSVLITKKQELTRYKVYCISPFTHNNCRNRLFMGNHCERHHSCSSNVNYVNKTIYLPSLENQVRPSCNKCYYCLLSFLGFKVTKMTTGLSSSFIFFSNSSSSFFLSGKRPVE